MIEKRKDTLNILISKQVKLADRLKNISEVIKRVNKEKKIK